MVFKVAILQINAVLKNPVKNTQTVICMMQEAAKLNADILLLPECFITSYTPVSYTHLYSSEVGIPCSIAAAATAILKVEPTLSGVNARLIIGASSEFMAWDRE